MIRRNFLFSCIICLAGLPCLAQADSAFVFSRHIMGPISDFEVDNLGNIYLLDPDNRLLKIGPAGDSLAVYNDVRRYGQLTGMDVTNPLKILLYYREFATIVMVDRFLNNINTVDLRKSNIFQAKAIGLAYDNNIWVFDELEAKLKRIGDDGSLIDQTTDTRQFAEQVPDPDIIVDQGGLVYLNDLQKGIFVFDHYGAYKQLVPVPALADMSVIDKNLWGRNKGLFIRYGLGEAGAQSAPIPAAYLPAIKIRIKREGVYVLKASGLDIYHRK